MPAHQVPERGGIAVADTSKERRVRPIAARRDRVGASGLCIDASHVQLDAASPKRFPSDCRVAKKSWFVISRLNGLVEVVLYRNWQSGEFGEEAIEACAKCASAF